MATQIGTVIDGKYEILKQIGKGGMSTVYLAMDKRLNKQWAVKEIKRTGVGKNNEQIVNEVPPDAEMMKRLDHPAIPRIVDIIDHKDSEYLYVVMDYVEGESLDKVLKEYGAQPQDVVIEWAKQIADALGYLHSQKPPIIYRDMKPANVMLKPEGNIKIIDFGIAREYKEANLADTTVLGTKGYASPEHYGGRQTDPRSDIYTLGMTMHHLLTGVDPRPADYRYAPIRQWNPELSGGLERIIDKCVSPDPKDRYQNCNELLYALDHYTEEEDSYKKTQKRKLFTFIISISLAVVLAIGGLTTTKLSQNAENKNYNSLISIDKLNAKTANEKISNAIKIDPLKTDAYYAYLNYICDDDKLIDKDEAEGFKTIYNDYKTAYSTNKKDYDSKFTKIAYEAGIAYLCFYDSDSTTDIAVQAEGFFKDIKDADCDEKELANYFYTICEFYTSTNDVKPRDRSPVFSSLQKCLNYILADNYEKEDENYLYMRLFVCRTALNFINVNRASIANPKTTEDKKKPISEDEVDNMLDTIKNTARDLKDAFNQEERGYKTAEYILENVDSVKKNIDIDFSKASESSQNS